MDPKLTPEDVAEIVRSLISMAKRYDQARGDTERAAFARVGFSLARKLIPELMGLLQALAMPTAAMRQQDLHGTPQGTTLYYDSDDPWDRLHALAEALQKTNF